MVNNVDWQAVEKWRKEQAALVKAQAPPVPAPAPAPVPVVPPPPTEPTPTDADRYAAKAEQYEALGQKPPTYDQWKKVTDDWSFVAEEALSTAAPKAPATTFKDVLKYLAKNLTEADLTMPAKAPTREFAEKATIEDVRAGFQKESLQEDADTRLLAARQRFEAAYEKIAEDLPKPWIGKYAAVQAKEPAIREFLASLQVEEAEKVKAERLLWETRDLPLLQQKQFVLETLQAEENAEILLEQQKVKNVFGDVFPQGEIEDVFNYAATDPDGFYTSLRTLIDLDRPQVQQEVDTMLGYMFPDMTDGQRDFILMNKEAQNQYLDFLFDDYHAADAEFIADYKARGLEPPQFEKLRDLGMSDDKIEVFFLAPVGTAEYAQALHVDPEWEFPEFQARVGYLPNGDTVNLIGAGSNLAKGQIVVVQDEWRKPQKVVIGDDTEYPFPAAKPLRLLTEGGAEIMVEVKNDYSVWQGNIQIGRLNERGEFEELGEGIPEIVQVLLAGSGDLAKIVGGTLNWLGVDGLGERLNTMGGRLQQFAPPDTLGEFTWEHIWNPRFWVEKVPRMAPVTLALAIPALIAAYGTMGVAGVIGLGKTGQFILGAIGGGSLSRAVESAFEAGTVFESILAKTDDPVLAKKGADGAFGKNLALVGLDIAQYGAFFAPTPASIIARLGGSGLAKVVVKGGILMVAAGSQGLEEDLQDIIVRIETGEPIAWDAQMKEAFTLGTIQGLGFQGLGLGTQQLNSILNRTRVNLPADIQDALTAHMDESVANGMTEMQAKIAAFDEIVMSTPEGQQALEGVIKQKKGEELRKELQTDDPVKSAIADNLATKKYGPPASEEVIAAEEQKAAPVAPQQFAGEPEAGVQAGMEGVAADKVVRPKGKGEELQAGLDAFQQVQEGKQAAAPEVTEKQIQDVEKGDIVEFEGEHYRVVNRDVTEGDVVTLRDLSGDDIIVPIEELSEAKITETFEKAKEGELEAELEGLEDYLRTDPIASYRGFVGKSKTTLTSILRGKDWPATITVKQAELLLQGQKVKASAKTGDRVRWEYVTDQMATQFGMTEDEFIANLQGIRRAQQRVTSIKVELAGTETVTTDSVLVISNIQSARDAVAQIEGIGESTERLDAIADDLTEGRIAADEANARFQMEQIVKMAEYYQNKIRTQEQTRKALTDYIKGNLPLFGKRQQQTMLTAVRNVKTELGMQKAIAKVNEFTEQNTQKTLTAKIGKLLKAAKRGKYVAETDRLLDTIRSYRQVDRNMARSQIEANIAEVQTGYKADGSLSSMTPEQMTAANDILALSGIGGMSSAELQNVLEEIKSVQETGRTLRQEKNERYKAKVDAVKADLISEATGGRGIEGKAPTGIKGPKPNLIKRIMKEAGEAANQFIQLDTLLDKISRPANIAPYESKTVMFGRNVTRSHEAEFAGVQNYNAVVQRKSFDIVAKHYPEGRTNAGLNRLFDDEVDLGTFTNTTGRVVSLKMTQAEHISIYMAMSDPTNEATLRKSNKFTDEMLEAVANKLGPAQQEWAEWALGFYQEYGDTVAPYWEEHFNTTMPRNPYYSPRSRDWQAGIPEVMQVVKERHDYASTAPSATKSRVDSTIAFRFPPAHKVLMDHIFGMEHWKAWAGTIKEWRSVIMDSEVRQAITEVHGRDTWQVLNNYVNDLARGSVERIKANNKVDKAANILRGNVVRAMLGIKPIVAIKQVFSVIAYSTQIGVPKYFNGVYDFWQSPIEHYRFMLENSAYLRDRFGAGMERDIALNMRAQDPTKQISGKGNKLDLTFLPIRTMDKFAVVQGYWASYKAEKARLEKSRPDMSEEEVIAEAMIFGQIVTERTQPTSSIQSLAQLQRGGPIVKLLTIFQTQISKYWQIYYVNGPALVYGRGSRAKAAYNLAVAWVVLPMLFQLATDAFRWREENQWRAALFGPINYLLIAGPIFQSLMGRFAHQNFQVQVSPVTSVLTDMERFLEEAVGLIDDWRDPGKDINIEDVWDMMEYLAKVGGELTGLPTPWLVQVEQGLREGNPWTLVFSKWSMRKPDPTTSEKARDALLNLGDWIFDDDGNPILKKGEPVVKDMNKLYTELNSIYKNMTPEDIKKSSSDPKIHSYADYVTAEVTHNSLLNKKLGEIVTDNPSLSVQKYIDLYQAWLTAPDADIAKGILDQWGMGEILKGNLTPAQKVLLRRYEAAEDKGAFLEEHPELTLNPRNEWLRANPEDNARLALGGDAKILTKEAYDLVQKMIEDLDIPDSAVVEYLPPADAVESYFKYNEALEQFSANSAEVMIIRAKDEKFQKWGEEREDNPWGPVDVPVEKLELIIKNRDMDEQYDALTTDEKEAFLRIPDEEHQTYADDRQRIDAYTKGFTGDMVETHVEYGQQVREHKGGSTEVKIWLKAHEDYHQARFDAKTMDTSPEDLEALNDRKLDIVAKWRDTQDSIDALADRDSETYVHDETKRAGARQDIIDLPANEGYADDMRRKEAIDLGITDRKTMEKYVQYWQMPTVGGEQELYLHRNEDLAIAMGKDITKLQSMREYEIDVRWADKDAEYEAADENGKAAMRGESDLSGLEEARDIHLGYAESLPTDGRTASEHALLAEEKGRVIGIIRSGDNLEEAISIINGWEQAHLDIVAYQNEHGNVEGYGGNAWNQRWADYYRNLATSLAPENVEYHKARRERDALENDVTHVDDYIDWYTTDRSSEQQTVSQWEEEWWLIEHPDFDKEMQDLKLWQEKEDDVYAEVPTRAIAELVEEYWTKEKGASRVTFRENNPALNVYFHLTSGYSLLGMDVSDYNMDDIFATGGVGAIPVTPEVTPSPEKVAEDEAKAAYKALRKTIGSGIDKNQTEWVEWASQQGSLQEAVDSYMTWFREGVFGPPQLAAGAIVTPTPIYSGEEPIVKMMLAWAEDNWENSERTEQKARRVIDAAKPEHKELMEFVASMKPWYTDIAEKYSQHPILGSLALLAGVAAPPPTSYGDLTTGEAAALLKTKGTQGLLPVDLWATYFKLYRVPKEKQAELTENVVLGGAITENDPYRSRAAGLYRAGFSTSSEVVDQLELVHDMAKGWQTDITALAHELAHHVWFAKLTDQQREEFLVAWDATEGTQIGDTVGWHDEEAYNQFEAYAGLYQRYIKDAAVIPKEFDKFFEALGVKDLRDWVELRGAGWTTSAPSIPKPVKRPTPTPTREEEAREQAAYNNFNEADTEKYVDYRIRLEESGFSGFTKAEFDEHSAFRVRIGYEAYPDDLWEDAHR